MKGMLTIILLYNHCPGLELFKNSIIMNSIIKCISSYSYEYDDCCSSPVSNKK